MTQFTIIGAGMAGLLAATMLRDDCSEVIEAQPELPNNHSALLRFRTDIVSQHTGIPFKKVQVLKTIGETRNPASDAVAYSLKATGFADLRSLVGIDPDNSTPVERFIAPRDFIKRLEKKVMAPIQYSTKTNDHFLTRGNPTISTIPMPALMKLLDYKEQPMFKRVAGETWRADVPFMGDICATVYFPYKKWLPYRASVVDKELILEFADTELNDFTAYMNSAESFMDQINKHLPEDHRSYDSVAGGLIATVLKFFGVDTEYLMSQCSGDPSNLNVRRSPMKYAKILPIDESVRREFIIWATEKHNIYSLGRFATWRPKVLLDDVINDINVIKTIAQSTNYDQRKVS